MRKILNEKEIERCYVEINFEDYEEIISAIYNDETEKLSICYIDKNDNNMYIYEDCSKESAKRIIEG